MFHVNAQKMNAMDPEIAAVIFNKKNCAKKTAWNLSPLKTTALLR